MPVFLDSPGKGTLEISQPHTYTVTPLPLSGDYPEKQTGATGLTTVTPNIESTSKARNDTSVKSNSAPKPSKAQLEIHRKWQAAAEAAGGPGARIVLSKPIAKKIIYDSLYNAFRPMNITEIHKVRFTGYHIAQ